MYDLSLCYWASSLTSVCPRQVECHPYLIQAQLLAHCGERGVLVTAYSPLGSPDRPWAAPGEPLLLEDPRVLDIARRNGRSPAQIIIRSVCLWEIQRYRYSSTTDSSVGVTSSKAMYGQQCMVISSTHIL